MRFPFVNDVSTKWCQRLLHCTTDVREIICLVIIRIWDSGVCLIHLCNPLKFRKSEMEAGNLNLIKLFQLRNDLRKCKGTISLRSELWEYQGREMKFRRWISRWIWLDDLSSSKMAAPPPLFSLPCIPDTQWDFN
jgi:hypothetical protein